MSSFSEFLQTKWTAAEESAIQDLVQEVEELRGQTLEFDEIQWRQAFEAMAPFRLQSSSSLKRGEIDSWVQANHWVAERSMAQSHPTWMDLLEINGLLRGAQVPEVRKEEVYLGPWSACPVDEMNETLEKFRSEILASTENHPLIKAALVQYWLVSIHPFPDANGRTAVLAADWILTQENFLPQSFESQLSAIIGHLPGRKTQSHPARAIQKVLKNLKFSYELALGRAAARS